METPDLGTSIIYFLVMLGILIIVFLILREVNCWYWKINRNIELQEEQSRLLQKLVQQFEKKETSGKEKKSVDVEQTSVNDPKVMEEMLKKFSNEKKG
jgi:flagellar biosynthesis/type III secretory pathway M-ring protein FliF/YscJ